MQFAKIASKTLLTKAFSVLVLFLFFLSLSSCTANEKTLSKKVEKYMNGLIKEKDDKLSVKADKIKFDSKSGSFLVSLLILKDNKKVSQSKVFVSRDAKFLSVTPILDLSKKPWSKEALPKRKEPEVNLFVMAGCPFGLQAEEVFSPIVEKLGAYIKFTPHYIIYSGYENEDFCIDKERKYCSMHGKAEAEEAVKQICIWNNYQNKWWKYIKKFNEDCNPNDPKSKPEECSKKSAESLEIDFDKIKKCTSNYKALLDKEIEISKKYEAKGSPTIIINDKSYEGERSPKKIFEAICSSFKKQPKVCKEEFNPVISSKKPTSGGCGN